MEIEQARSLKVIASMSWNSSWPTIPRSLGKLSLLGLYLTEWGLHAFHDLRTFVIIRRIFLLNYLRARQFELYGEFYMFSWWKDLRQMPRRNSRLAEELSQNLAETWCGRWLWKPSTSSTPMFRECWRILIMIRRHVRSDTITWNEVICRSIFVYIKFSQLP